MLALVRIFLDEKVENWFLSFRNLGIVVWSARVWRKEDFNRRYPPRRSFENNFGGVHGRSGHMIVFRVGTVLMEFLG